jgi:GDPmannose 4,6-dehydratase
MIAMPAGRALISGITGQDGSYLAEWLLAKGYEVHGVVRRVAIEDPEHRLTRLDGIRTHIKLHAASLESYASIHQVVGKVMPDECYHLAAQSFVSYSFDDEFSTLNANINGTHYLLAAAKNIVPRCRFYFAGSSEMFGKADEVPQTETRFHPRSTYGISKVAGFDLTRNYRGYGMHASSGIIQPESPRRDSNSLRARLRREWRALRRKIKELRLGNLDAKRDWGHAREYAGHVADAAAAGTGRLRDRTGQTHRPGVCGGFCARGADYRDYVMPDADLFRPAEVNILQGDASKARETGLGAPHRFEALVQMTAARRWEPRRGSG